MFNSLKCVKKLEEAGVPREQAEIHIQIMSELIESNLVTGEQFKEGIFLLNGEFNRDMSTLRSELKEDMSTLRTELKDDMTEFRGEIHGELEMVRHGMREMESRLVIKLGTTVAMGAFIALIGSAVALAKFI